MKLKFCNGFSQNYDLIAFSSFYSVVSPIVSVFLKKILLQGLDPNLRGYDAMLALYEREAGPRPKKVCHFIFLEHMLLEEFGIKA